MQSAKIQRSSEYYSVMLSPRNTESSKINEKNDSVSNTYIQDSEEFEDHRESDHSQSDNGTEADESDPLVSFKIFSL